MNEFFVAQDVVDEFISAIWTERYSVCGEVQLVTAATPFMREKLAEGTFLGLRGSKEVMQLETQSIEKNQLTVIGKTLTRFLDERPFWKANPAVTGADDAIADYTVTDKVGQAIADVVEDMVIDTTPITGTYAASNLDNLEDNEIPYLELGEVDISGDDERMTFVIGPLYTAISQVATQFGVGIQMYLEYGTVETGYLLKFRVYRGENRTTILSNKPDGITAPFNVEDPPAAVDWGSQLVRLVPDVDSLSDLKEIRSIAFYKNVAYVYYKGDISIHYEDPLNIPEGFDRRILIVNAEGEPVGRKVTYQTPQRYRYGMGPGYQTYVAPPTLLEIAAWRAQQAKDALANNNYIKAVDAQTSPDNTYKFGVDYGLGDIVELQGLTGIYSKARITEYIRSQDRTGEREYPTISVL